MNKLPLAVFFLFLIGPVLMMGQTDTISTQDIPTIEISALKINTSLLNSPLAISRYEATTIQDTRQQLSLQDYLTDIPGLFTLNANNYAQDLRVSIRGFGARAAFGIRGIKIIVDGIPETTPDGQGQVDNLNLGIIQNIEVIKGSASVLYGNASGGVININTLSEVPNHFLEAGLTFGGFTYSALADSLKLSGQLMQQYQVKGGFRHNNTTAIFQGSLSQSDGYRVQSGFKSTNLNARVIHRFSPKSKLSFQTNYTNSPMADDPGGLNLEATEFNRSQARDRNVLFKTGEAITQFKVGLSYTHAFENGHEFESYGFYSNRDFSGKLPFEFNGLIELNRHYFGQGSSYNIKQVFSKGLNEIRIGYELAHQSDDRQRFKNLEGEKGDLGVDQVESFSNVALYLLDNFSYQNWFFSAGIRYDWNRLSTKDQWLTNGDGSGNVQLSALNPSIGLTYRLTPSLSAYTNFRLGFETPTLTELSANPNAEIGFNTDLKAQHSNNFEIGLRGQIANQFTFDLTYFHINTRNELVSYELEQFPDREFYRNAGATRRDGIEWSGSYFFHPEWSVSTSYTFSDFIYKNFENTNGNFSNKQLPGIPKHFATFSLNHTDEDGLNFRIQARYNGALFTNDSNEVTEPSYVLLNTSVGYRFHIKNYTISPFFGINNLLNEKYNDNIRINAFGSRFYEPGPELNFYAGVRFRWGKNTVNGKR